ncbi:MAG: bifunctional phosphopantothenoylcysteine decarboxylase/phosphopantothenate--cysteine ligase CoaBC [Deltaproteobacteria bacterium]|nr:bifunctional phosphopantothenoylcysteine decarboxylase/phosphopantothenate--cysteine ligase CoaBC [Deltaproteobacteria bacterium]
MKGKKIIVGVTGGIAAYKSAELVRLLVKEGANTFVAMTRNAARFVTPLTFETLSNNRVIRHMFDNTTAPLDHITWAQEADLVIISPATANFIGKIANGIADDFLSTLVIASTAKILVCPSMNSQMFANAAVQVNLKRIAERGYVIMDPAEGELACHTEGKGRLPDPQEIMEKVRFLISGQDLKGLRILVTAGPTVEPLDPVRFISNRSTGRMGYAVAKAAGRRGATVTLVSGPTALTAPRGMMIYRVQTALEMKRAVLDCSAEADVIIKAAAVSDYRPRERADQKIKKGAETMTIDLEKNPDILAELGRTKRSNKPLLVGFAAETEDLLINAKEKLQAKDIDMIVANDVSREDAGFASETNIVKILYRDGTQEDLPLMKKDEVADHLLDKIKDLIGEKE